MLEIGTIAPDFSLKDQTGTPRTLSQLRDNGRLVLYFYPADFTPVCTRQACGFRDQHDRLITSGTRVAGISTQTVESHQRFSDKHSLPFPILADTDKGVCREYQALGPFGLWTSRVSYLIDESGRIADRVRAGINLGKHMSVGTAQSHRE